MTQPRQLHVLAEIGGVAVAEEGPLVIVVDRGTGSWTTVGFVSAVLALVVGGFGAVTLVLAATGGSFLPWWVGTIFLLVGIVCAGAAFAVLQRIGKARRRPVSDYRPVLIFDRARRVLVDADGAAIASFAEIRFDTRMQMTSSSPVLVVMTPFGPRNIKRGNPFNGGLGTLEATLTAAVFASPPR